MHDRILLWRVSIFNCLMNEIEIKFILPDRQGIIDLLRSKFCIFTAPKKQVDTVYAKKVGDLHTFMSNDVFLRIRIVNDSQAVLTLKKPISREELSKREHETKIDDSHEMEEMLSLMGFQKAVVSEKTRITTNYNGIAICIDSVKGLGDFIELEKQDNRPPDVVRRELLDCADALGLKPAEEVKEGYDILMLRKKV